MDPKSKNKEFSYRESSPNESNQIVITIVDSNEKSETKVERFSEDEMIFLGSVVDRLKEK